MNIQISKRLQTIASFVLPYRHIIDVGTDHCLVPIYLFLNQTIDSAIATDINQGPVDEAKKNIRNYQLENKIDVRLGNGLEPIHKNDPCDVIIVAGMGGALITDILDTGNILDRNKRLILQPNVGETRVRRWLQNNHYEIVAETLIEEDQILYEVICAEKTNQIVFLTEDEITFGPKLLDQKNELFINKWKQILDHKKKILKNIPIEHENRQLFIKEIAQIEAILNN